MITDNLLCGYLRTVMFSASMMDGFLQAVLKNVTNSTDCISFDTMLSAVFLWKRLPVVLFKKDCTRIINFISHNL